MTLSKKDTLESVAKIFHLMSEGKLDDEIADEMGLDVELVATLKTQMIEMKVEELKTKPVEHTYVEYMLHQMTNVNDLTTIITEMGDTKQYNATMVGAIRARAEIWDKLMTKGQECSVIKKAAERTETTQLSIIAELSNSELRAEVSTSIKKLMSMTTRHGETDFMKLPVPGVLHTGPVAEDEKKKKKKKKDGKKKKKKMGKSKARTSKVSKGRIRELPPSPLDKKGKTDE